MAIPKAKWYFQQRPLGTDAEWTTNTEGHTQAWRVADLAIAALVHGATVGLLVEVRLVRLVNGAMA